MYAVNVFWNVFVELVDCFLASKSQTRKFYYQTAAENVVCHRGMEDRLAYRCKKNVFLRFSTFFYFANVFIFKNLN